MDETEVTIAEKTINLTTEPIQENLESTKFLNDIDSNREIQEN